MELIAFIASLQNPVQTTPPAQPEPVTDLVLDSSVVAFPGAETLINSGGGQFLQTPNMWWHNGKTYKIHRTNYTFVNGYGQAYIFVYDENDGLHKQYRVGNTQILHPEYGVPDSHTGPSMHVDDAGNIFVVQERTHDSPIDIYKGSFAKFEFLSEKINPGTGATAESSYHNLIKLPDGNGFSWCRMTKLFKAYSGGHGASVEASNGFESWGSLVRYTTNPRPVTTGDHGNPTDRTRHYPHVPMYRQIVGDYMYLLRTQRVDNFVTGLGIWHKFYIHRTPLGTGRGVVWENLVGTPYSQDTSGANYLTETVLDDEYMYYSSGAETNNSYQPVATVSLHPKVFIVTGDAHTGNLLLHIIDVPTRIQVTKALAITGYHVYDPSALQRHAVVHIAYIEDGQYLEIGIEIDYPGSVIKTHLFRSYDLGATFEDQGDVFPEIATSTTGLSFPFNYHNIPYNRNFIAMAVAADGVTANTTISYFKRAAKGVLQSETPNIIVPAPSFSDANNFFDYLAIDGQISRTGNNVTGLTDQFGLRNATGSNNPQWDGTDLITLNGTNQDFNIPTAGFSGITECTFFAVVSRSAAVSCGILLFSDNTVSSSYIGWFLADAQNQKPSFRFKEQSGTTLIEHGQYIPSVDELVLMSFVVDGRCKVDIYVNGAKQYYESRLYTTLAQYEKRGTMNFGTINSVKIGRLDTSGTDGFYPLRFKRLMMKNTVYDFETFRSLEKKIADAHGITLNYGYQ